MHTTRPHSHAGSAATIVLIACLLPHPPSTAQTVPAASPATTVPAVSTDAPAKASDTALGDVVVTAGKPAASLPRTTQPSSVLQGPALDARIATSLGETLSQEAGVTSTYYGPGASRPIIRGLDGDRVRIMQNGGGVVDASSLSFDHATTLEPLTADRIEILRGPAVLLHGGSATGGAINVIDNRIPTAPIDKVAGRSEIRAGGADAQRAAVAVVEAGDGRFALHADAYRRMSDDTRIPGYARSQQRRALDAPGTWQPRGRLPNSFTDAGGGSLGGAYTWRDGYAGMALGALRASYGTPAETGMRIDQRKDTIDFAAEARSVSPMIEALRVRIGHSDYEHQEKLKDSGQVNTTFRNRGTEARVEAAHAAAGPLRGTAGLQIAQSDFSALGSEAYVPATRTSSTALFAVEQASFGRLSLSAGARAEQTRLQSAGDASAAGLDRFGPPRARAFGTRSASVGAAHELAGPWTVSANGAFTQRAPTYSELFANGPHAATGTWEIGDPDLSRESSMSFDLGLRYRERRRQAGVSAFRTQFRNYLLLSPTGRFRTQDGAQDTPLTPGVTASGSAASLPEYRYGQVPALFTGMEAMVRWPLAGDSVPLDAELRADSVRATNRDTGEPLPRIAPLRAAAALSWQAGGLLVRGEAVRVFAQDRVAPAETLTHGYTLVNAYASVRLRESASGVWEVFLRATNLFNQEARSHTSLIKDIAPLPGRGILVGIRTLY